MEKGEEDDNEFERLKFAMQLTKRDIEVKKEVGGSSNVHEVHCFETGNLEADLEAGRVVGRKFELLVILRRKLCRVEGQITFWKPEETEDAIDRGKRYSDSIAKLKKMDEERFWRLMKGDTI